MLVLAYVLAGRFNKMGNFCSTPRQRLQFEIRLDQDDKELVRYALQKIADDADVSAQLGRQKHERRRQRYEAGYGQNGQHGSRNRQPGRNGLPGETYRTAPEFPLVDPQGRMSPRSPPYQDPRGIPPGTTGAYGGYRAYQPTALDGELNEETFDNEESDDHSSPGRQHGNVQPRAIPKSPIRGRTRQAPLARRPRRQEPQQDAMSTYMAGAAPTSDQQE
ncbi:MAG: hypothetical protein Q9188_006191 [Gyalolechia gomerana]